MWIIKKEVFFGPTIKSTIFGKVVVLPLCLTLQTSSTKHIGTFRVRQTFSSKKVKKYVNLAA